MAEFRIILDAMIETLPKETSNFGDPIKLKELYIPPAHKKALNLYSNLIVGDRGVGKSTWTAALADPKKRKVIENNIPELENASVTVGFSEKPNHEKYPDKDTINNLLEENTSPHFIWKTVVMRWLSQETNMPIPINKWQESIFWVKNNPEDCSKIFYTANNLYKEKNSSGLILFDALDVTSDNWEKMDNIVRELLRLVLELKVYSNIHAKVFLREDQFSRTITNFSDASKLLPNKTELTWERYDLHGLLWQQLCNAKGEGGDTLRNYYKEVVGTDPEDKNDYWIIADKIKKDEEIQKKLFEKLAGPWMGKDKKRGVPYIWTVGHLADGNNHTSPRSFLLAIKTAAEDSLNKTSNFPLHYESIKKGVQSASKNRVAEIAEDYPWINNLCDLLNGKNVPISFNDIEKEWIKEYPGGPTAIKTEKLPPQDSERGWLGIKKELVRLGIFEEMRDERINMPDLFRIGFGLGRKGGITPIA
jgi:hypothetical protein